MPDARQFSTWEEAVRWLREQPGRRALAESAYYDDPLVQAADRYWRSTEWAGIRALLPAGGGRALDVGAGRGIASYALARDGFDVTALEPDGSALVGAQAIRDLAADTGLPIAVRQDFSEKLPFPDAHFDLVFARAVLHHTRDMAAACAEFFRVLKPGGMMVAVREHVLSDMADLPVFLDQHPLHKLYGGENAFLLQHYADAIGAAGFRLDRVLTPFRSPINYAPHTVQTLQGEIAQRMGGRLPGLRAAWQWVLALPGVWALLVPLLDRIDRRPGRLYSFVGRRP
jgi:SAM-dependent methyltransferase